jgi:hypothetical protein
MTNDSELAARALARWLAPYVAEELGLPRWSQSKPSPSASYDDATCAVYVTSLGDVVLDNAETFFARLEQEGIGSLALANAISVASRHRCPRHTIRSSGASLPPWAGLSRPAEPSGRPGGGIAARMLRAVREEDGGPQTSVMASLR